MKNILKISLFCLIGYLFNSCAKEDLQYKSFLNNHEVVYPGKVDSAHSRAGNLRIGITWHPSADPSITRYVIYWNNKADSVIFNSTDHKQTDSVTVIIPNLNEYIYTFTVYSYDDKGNKSVPIDINNAKVYGPIYQSGLVNRSVNATNPYSVFDDGRIKLNFLLADTAEINVGTTISYTSRTNNAVKKAVIPRDSTSIIIPDFKSGTTITYKSSYVPTINAIDTFAVNNAETFPQVFGFAPCDKSLFRKVKLNYDMDPYEGDTDIDRLWDGSVGPQGFPNIFHSNGSSSMPQSLTFDMGALYSIGAIEETGRNCCHNPDDFEVWGIADISNANTSVRPNDPSWAAESTAKGWVLLGEVKRNDDGSAPYKYNFPAESGPIRYIRIRVMHNSDGDNNYTNMSEITMFKDVLK